tara:strand:+ start:3009 stop:5360 length:2352 start_codon:yes stop_codon:yes gene_type:complete
MYYKAGNRLIMQLKNHIKDQIKRISRKRVSKIIYRVIGPLINRYGLRMNIGGKKLDKDKETIMIVTHESSITGAPILALNICKELGTKYNIIAIILRDGELKNEFIENSAVYILPRFSILSAGMLRNALNRQTKVKTPKYAIVNSIVSARSIQPLRNNKIPVMTLIHEFSAYIRPLDLMESVGLWSNRLVFSNELTKQDILENTPEIRNCKMSILPQGKCNNLKKAIEGKGRDNNGAIISGYIKSLDNDTFLILGAGQIQPRKGLDLFVAVANQILKNNKHKQIEFVWIGSGYDPNNDFSVSLWINDQINRSGIEKNIKIFEPAESYGDLMERADIFLVTSRLDPLPNVAIDAMFAGTPTHCFEKACGLANLYKYEELLKNRLVADYFDINEMAKQVSELINNKEVYDKVAKLCAKKGREWFNMTDYANKLVEIGNKIANIENQKVIDYNFLIGRKEIRYSYWESNISKSRSRGLEEYLMRWQSEVWPKKPEPGFHPGIYRDNMMNNKNLEDPYVHYIKSNKPKGLWAQNLIAKETIIDPEIEKLKVGIHIHIHYPELTQEILKAININSIKAGIHVTYSGEDKMDLIRKIFMQHETKYDSLTKVPNKGRDMGPLITELSAHMESNYDIYAHIHTKKSVTIAQDAGIKWRKYLIKNLIGYEGNSMADKIISTMKNDEEIGLVFPTDPYCVGWGSNYGKALEVAKKIGIDTLPRSLNFPVGNMFWVRSGALRSLYNLNLNWNDYPCEPIRYDGTILHAIERLIPIIANSNGYNYKMTYVSGITR